MGVSGRSRLMLAAACGFLVLVAYGDGAPLEPATVMRFSGGSWVPVGRAGFSGDGAYYTSLAIDPSGTMYLAYEDLLHFGCATVVRYQ
jgi:hypothetical protein